MTKSNDAQRTFASFYDWYDGPEHRTLQFELYGKLAQEAGGPVLELSCGTGLITLDLARHGHEITGLDVSSDMLNVAARKLEDEPEEVRECVALMEGDMSEFELGQRFSLVLIPTNSFCHLTSLEKQRACLGCVREHLRPDGMLVIEERHYPPSQLARLQGQRGVVRQWKSGVNPATGLFTTFNSALRYIDVASQTICERTFIDESQSDGTVRRFVRPEAEGYSWDHRHYFNRFELQLLIESAGFRLEHLWGGHRREPFTADSESMVFVARRT
jgi:ubiquinone/menaquinone biosynthesis C-methylase UbiE